MMRVASWALSASSRDRDALRVRAMTYRTALDRWDTFPPNEAQREGLLRAALDLDIEVMALARAPRAG
jgi:hypothetical protein